MADICTEAFNDHFKLLDSRLTNVRYVNSAFVAPEVTTRRAWEAHAERVRRRVLVSAGLGPAPERTPLKARVTDRWEGNGFSVEKVHFESRPGFLVTGNLYRPLNARGKRPAILCPHGHWEDGRLEKDRPAEGSVIPRCIMLARLGFVVFSYDMIGYNDHFQVIHRWADETLRYASLYGISPFGLQLWNSLRAVDFIASLPDVNAKRIGCTGASGGATQTYYLALVDDRVRVVAPVCMLSAHYQGGCTCEEGPLLHLGGLSTLDVVGALAPRPVLLPSVTGDWTNQNPDCEIPALRRVWALYNAQDRLGNVHFDATHNYNRDTREYVYAWFVKWLGGKKNAGERIREYDVAPPPREALRLWEDGAFPKTYKRDDALIDALAADAKQPFARPPKTASELRKLVKRWQPIYAEVLGTQTPDDVIDVDTYRALAENARFTMSTRGIGRHGCDEKTPALWIVPKGAGKRPPAALVAADGGKASLFAGNRPGALLGALLTAGVRVLAIDLLGQGETAPLLDREPINRRDPLYYAFNPSLLAHRVQEIVTTIESLRQYDGVRAPALVGTGAGAVAAILARPLAGRLRATVVDLGGCDTADDAFWMGDCFHPLIRKLGDVRGAVALGHGEPLLLARADAQLARWARATYRLAGKSGALRVSRQHVSAQRAARWIGKCL